MTFGSTNFCLSGLVLWFVVRAWDGAGPSKQNCDNDGYWDPTRLEGRDGIARLYPSR